MSWEGAMINMLRVVINDNDYQGSYSYTDARLTELLVVAGMYVCQDIKFANNYTIDVVCSTISPDPYTQNDKVFMNMTVMKAACILDQGTFRTKAFMSGLEAKCGPATMKTLQHLQGFKDLLNMGPCKIYDDLKHEQQFGGENLNSIVHFVLSPFTHDDFDPVYAFTNYYDTQRMIR